MCFDDQSNPAPGTEADEREQRIRSAVAHMLSCNNPDDPRIRMLSAVVIRVLLAEEVHES